MSPEALRSEALLHAGKARTMAANLFNDPQASQVDAGDLLISMAQLVDLLCLAVAHAEADRKDAERYRWLRNEAWGGNNKRGPHLVTFKPGYLPSAFTDLAEEAADAAIDAAMKEQSNG